MVSVHDVAAYILQKAGSMTAMKLQKLAYYAQAWSLVWEERPLYDSRIEAWANGPVIPDLYERHRGQFNVDTWIGDPSKLGNNDRDTVDAVIGHYSKFTAQQLSELTHNEDPWNQAREGLNPGDRGNREISTASLHEYYSGL